LIDYPQKLTVNDSEERRQRCQVIRLDTMMHVPGLVQSADVETGKCFMMLANGEKQEHDFKPGGLTILEGA
jgi:hypothetical protein